MRSGYSSREHQDSRRPLRLSYFELIPKGCPELRYATGEFTDEVVLLRWVIRAWDRTRYDVVSDGDSPKRYAARHNARHFEYALRVGLPAGNWLEGSYESAFSLLYGYQSLITSALGKHLMVGGQPIGEEAINDVLTNASILKPRDQLSIAVMPVQDAMDLAVFLASVQIQMERFLPGDSLCGGPIDVMVLKTAPVQEILWFPGKDLKHPLAGRGN